MALLGLLLEKCTLTCGSYKFVRVDFIEIFPSAYLPKRDLV